MFRRNKKKKESLKEKEFDEKIDSLSHLTESHIARYESYLDSQINDLDNKSEDFLTDEMDSFDTKEKIITSSFKINENSKDLKKKLDKI